MNELNWFLKHGMGEHNAESLANVLDLCFIVAAISNLTDNKQAVAVAASIQHLRALNDRL